MKYECKKDACSIINKSICCKYCEKYSNCLSICEPEDGLNCKDLIIIEDNLENDDKLKVNIKVTYILKEYPRYDIKTSHYTTYEDFGEWICRQFDKINVIDIKTNNN